MVDKTGRGSVHDLDGGSVIFLSSENRFEGVPEFVVDVRTWTSFRVRNFVDHCGESSFDGRYIIVDVAFRDGYRWNDARYIFNCDVKTFHADESGESVHGGSKLMMFYFKMNFMRVTLKENEYCICLAILFEIRALSCCGQKRK